VGGSRLKEGSQISWGIANAANGGSALTSIPETAWNDTNSTVGLSASGGGPSACATGSGGSCAGFPKPSWQDLNITGIPNDGVRDIPDITFSGSPAHDGYIVCAIGSCATNFPGTVILPVGGTSAATSVAAAMTTLLNQYVVGQGIQTQVGLGNINPNLYHLVQVPNTPTILHDIKSGNNVVPCNPGTTGCPILAPFQYGFSAGTGYDLVTGLGSINANDFFTNWGWISGNPNATTITTVSATSGQGAVQQVTPGSPVSLTVNVASLTGAPTGNVTLVSGSQQLASAPLLNSSATINLTPAAGTYTITALYSGDGTFLPSTSAPITLFAADYTVTTATTSFNLFRGQSVSIPITITPSMPDYNPTVTLGCYGLPTEATCTFTPATVSPTGGPAVATLVLATTASNSAIHRTPANAPAALYAVLVPGIFGGIFLAGYPKASSQRLRAIAFLAVLLSSTVWWSACSGSGKMPPPDPGSFPTGSIPFSVTASTGGAVPIFHTVTLTMNLQ
jgi:hypothetical protein